MNAVPWLLFAFFGGALMTWSLATGKAWHWGELITRAENPGGYFQFLLGAGLPTIFALVAAYESVR